MQSIGKVACFFSLKSFAFPLSAKNLKLPGLEIYVQIVLFYEKNLPLSFFCAQNDIIKLLRIILLHLGKITKNPHNFFMPEFDAKPWLFSFIQCVATEAIWKFINNQKTQAVFSGC